jgi:hypothetical protein
MKQGKEGNDQTGSDHRPKQTFGQFHNLHGHHVTGLGAACRAGAHVSCATRQESVILSE